VFNSIRLSLTAWYVGVLLMIVLLIGVVTYLAFSRSLSGEIDESLQSSAQAVALQIDPETLESIQPTPREDNSGPGNADDDDDGDNEEEDEGEEDEDDDGEVRYFSPSGGDTFYLVLTPEGVPLVNPANVRAEGIPDTEAAATAADRGEEWSTVSAEHEDVRLYSLALRHDGETVGVVQVGRSLAEQERQLTGLLIVLAVAGGGGLVLAAAGGLLVAGRALRPIRQSFERQRGFVADASHELRTPLTIIRGNAELLELSETAQLDAEDRRELEDIVGQAAYMEQLVADLSLLARLDEGRLPLRKEPVDVRELVETAARSARTLGAGKRLAVEVDVPAGMIVHADPVRLQEVLLALVENAVRHVPEGGRIRIASENERTARITVSDNGPGVDPAHLERIFERFYRLDEARTRAGGGTGLGLSIAQAIARAHGGEITAANRPGGGALFTLTLPGATDAG
jgi:signal transduction histidine kinase